jgi:WD40 repeat protein
VSSLHLSLCKSRLSKNYKDEKHTQRGIVMRKQILFISFLLALVLFHPIASYAQEKIYSIGALEVSPNGKYIAVGTIYGELNIYDVATYTLQKALQKNEDMFSAVKWSPDSVKVAAATYDGHVSVWDFRSATKTMDKHTETNIDVSIPISQIVNNSIFTIA